MENIANQKLAYVEHVLCGCSSAISFLIVEEKFERKKGRGRATVVGRN